jgi:hypothetical protein
MDGVCGKATTSLSRAKRTRKVEGGGFLPEKEAVPMKQLLGVNQGGRRKINMSQTEKDLLKNPEGIPQNTQVISENEEKG